MSDPNDPQLQRLEKMHQLILDAAGEGVYGLDANGITTFVNRAAERILGWHPDDVIGKPLHDIHHPFSGLCVMNCLTGLIHDTIIGCDNKYDNISYLSTP